MQMCLVIQEDYVIENYFISKKINVYKFSNYVKISVGPWIMNAMQIWLIEV